MDKYCQDLIEEYKQKKELIDFSEFIHDEIITDPAGNKVPIIYIDGLQVPIADIITMDKETFVKVYTTPNAAEMYDNYMRTLIVLEGEEVLNGVLASIRREHDRLQQDFVADLSYV